MYTVKNVFRKEEHDWKMVYLAREEDTPEAVIEWKFDVSMRKLSIKDVQFKCDSKVYENGRVTWEFQTHAGGF